MAVKNYDQCYKYIVDTFQALFCEFFSQFVEEVNTADGLLDGLDTYSLIVKFISWLADEQKKAVEQQDKVLWWYLDFMITWGPLVIVTCTAIWNNDSELLLHCYQVALHPSTSPTRGTMSTLLWIISMSWQPSMLMTES